MQPAMESGTTDALEQSWAERDDRPVKNVEREDDHFNVVGTTGNVADPVCGMTVDPAKAVSVEHEGEKLYFCCQGCATKFRTAPAKYLKAKQESHSIPIPMNEEAKTDYTCPMHPEVHKAGPGSCPKCGMALEPATVEAPASRTEYIEDVLGACPWRACRDHASRESESSAPGTPPRWERRMRRTPGVG